MRLVGYNFDCWVAGHILLHPPRLRGRRKECASILLNVEYNNIHILSHFASLFPFSRLRYCCCCCCWFCFIIIAFWEERGYREKSKMMVVGLDGRAECSTAAAAVKYVGSHSVNFPRLLLNIKLQKKLEKGTRLTTWLVFACVVYVAATMQWLINIQELRKVEHGEGSRILL